MTVTVQHGSILAGDCADCQRYARFGLQASLVSSDRARTRRTGHPRTQSTVSAIVASGPPGQTPGAGAPHPKARSRQHHQHPPAWPIAEDGGGSLKYSIVPLTTSVGLR